MNASNCCESVIIRPVPGQGHLSSRTLRNDLKLQEFTPTDFKVGHFSTALESGISGEVPDQFSGHPQLEYHADGSVKRRLALVTLVATEDGLSVWNVQEEIMAANAWNETGRVWEEDHGLLDEGQVAKCDRAD